VSPSPVNDNPGAEVAAQRSGGRIVVGVDGSSGSQAALRWALVEAATRNVPLHAVMCSAPAAGNRTDERDGSAPNQDATKLAASLADATAATGAAATVTASVIRGHPAQVLLDAAHDANVLVVGCRGHGRVVGTLIGSVSQLLVTRAPCVVVVVPDADQIKQREAAAASQRADRDERSTPTQAESWPAMHSET
jgi:nucleotide-binding universal stress UspA family protein